MAIDRAYIGLLEAVDLILLTVNLVAAMFVIF